MSIVQRIVLIIFLLGAFLKAQDVQIDFGQVSDSLMELTIDTPYDIGGFQFDIVGTELGSASGGIAAENGFTVSTGGETILGFSFSGDVIPAGSNGILVNVEYTATAYEICFDLGTGAISDGNGEALPVEFGDCLDFDCVTGDDIDWESDYQSEPFDNEFSATIAAAQVWIDGVEQTGGQVAAFGEDGWISGLDSDGATFFPPGETFVYEIPIWSNQSSGEVMTFKYYDATNSIIINLNEIYTFENGDIIGNGFEPFILTGELLPCDCAGNYFDCNADCGGEAFDDDCGICSEGNTGHEANSDIDCNGDCFGQAYLDSCEECSGGNTDHEADSDKDDCGVCFGNNADIDCNGDCAENTPEGCKDENNNGEC